MTLDDSACYEKTVSYYTPDEYLALDEAAPEGIRLEYWKGNLFAQGQHYRPRDTMISRTNGTPTHNQICITLLTFFNLAVMCAIAKKAYAVVAYAFLKSSLSIG